MIVRVRKVGDKFIAVIPPQIANEMGLVDGSAVEIRPVAKPEASTIQYATVEEALEAYEKSRVKFEGAYRELAK